MSILVFLFLPILSFASINVVKVTSEDLSTRQVLQGSGLGFQFHGQDYVLTSDHVVIHQNQNVHHQITNAQGQVVTAEFLVADFGKGLALLKLRDVAVWPDLLALPSAPALAGQPAVLLGFPALSDTLLRNADGTIQHAAKQESLLIEITNMILVKGGFPEFGMSGGIITTEDGRYLGTLTHQRFNQATNNDAVAVPAGTALEWAKSFLSGDTSVVTLVQTRHQQLWTKDPAYFSTGRLTINLLRLLEGSVLRFSLNSNSVSPLYRRSALLESWIQEMEVHGCDLVLHNSDYVTFFRRLQDPTFHVIPGRECPAVK